MLAEAGSPVEFAQGLVDVTVPEAVDDGVEQWGHNGVDHGHQFVEVKGADGLRPGVHEGGGAVEEGHHGQVGRAGGEGLLAASPSGDPQHCGHDVGVGDHGRQQGGGEHS